MNAKKTERAIGFGNVACLSAQPPSRCSDPGMTLEVLQQRGRGVHTLQRTREHANANRVWRRQSKCPAVLPGRGPRRGRRQNRHPICWSRRAAAYQDHRSVQAEARRRLHPEHAQVPTAGKPQSVAARAQQLPRIFRIAARSNSPGVHLLFGSRRVAEFAGNDRVDRQTAGKFHSFRGTKVVCTYHPAFLLRSPSFKKETWEDMKILMREMGVEL